MRKTTLAKLDGRDGQVRCCHLSFSRFGPGDENNASQGPCHTPFLFGSQKMETCLIPFNSLSDLTVVFRSFA